MRIGIKASAPPDSAPYTFRIRPVNEGQLCAARALPKKKEQLDGKELYQR